jgi:hypothetical protein
MVIISSLHYWLGYKTQPMCPRMQVHTSRGTLRATSHYGCPNWEAAWSNGQTLLRVQRNGLQIHSQQNIGTGAFSRTLCEASKAQTPKSKPFGHELPWPLDLDGHSVKPPKAKPKVQRKKQASHFILCPKQPLRSNGQDLVNFILLCEKKLTASRV